jgi:hypothetical protein
MTKLFDEVVADIRALAPDEQVRVAEVVLDFLRVRGEEAFGAL